MKTDKLIILDLEATCWATREEAAQNQSEIIEIGVVLYNTKTKLIERSEGIIVKPRDSVVSEFCTLLTTLTQADVDLGISLEEAMTTLSILYDSVNTPWISYGDYDRNMIQRQCDRLHIWNPMSADHTNIKVEFAKKLGIKPCGMDHALSILGLKLEGTHHRGIDDAINITKIYAALR